MEKQRYKLKRIFIGTIIFLILELFASGMLYLVWKSSPIESRLWLKDNYFGVFQYLIIGFFYIGTTMVSIQNSIFLSKRFIEEKNKKLKEK